MTNREKPWTPSHDGAVVPEWLTRRAQLTPDFPALETQDGSWSFQELDRAAAALARMIASALPEGMDDDGDTSGGPGPRVAVLMGNNAAFVLSVHAVAKVGAVLVPLNTRLTPSELAWQVLDSGAAVLLHDRQHAPLARAVARAATRTGPAEPTQTVERMAPERTSTDPASAGAPATIQRMEVDAHRVTPSADVAAPRLREHIRLNAVHSIVYTSGTTGKPKGAMLTYGNFWWNVTASALHLGVAREDRWLACMPLFHVGGLSILLRSVVYGMPVLLHESFEPSAVNEALDEAGVTLLSVVAVMLDRMLAERGSKPYPDTVRAVLVGGGPAPAALLQRARDAGLPALQTYGLTEAASQVATLAPQDVLRKLGSAGKPLFPVGIRILPVRGEDDGVPSDAKPESMSPGQIGEIAIAGPTVSPGYWGFHAEDGALTRTDVWFRTGDLGFVDEEGYLYVVDRRDDMFVSGGENVYPAEVEAALASHPGVAEAAVVGVPDHRWGRVPVALIVARDAHTVDTEDVRRHCRKRLAAYKVPTRIVVVSDLPRNAAGKLLRREVRRRAMSPGDEPPRVFDEDGRKIP